MDDPRTEAPPDEEFYAIQGDASSGDCFDGPDTMENLLDNIKDNGDDVEDFLFLPASCARRITVTSVVEFKENK